MEKVRRSYCVFILFFAGVFLSGCSVARLPGHTLEFVGKVVAVTGEAAKDAGKVVEATGGMLASTVKR